MKRLVLVLTLLGLGYVPCTLGAELLFQPTGGSWATNTILPQGYGDRIVAPDQNGFHYGLDGGITPNIVARFNQLGMPGPIVTAPPLGTGDLPDAAYPSTSETQPFEYDLIADPGYSVKLRSFNMAIWPGINETINSVSVLDGNNNILWSQTPADIAGAPDATHPNGTHTHFAFPDLQSQTLKIEFDSTNVDADDVGITNVVFSQATASPNVPEPSTFLIWSLLGGCGIALGCWRRKRAA